MQKREIRGLDRSATSEQERAPATEKAGQRSYSRKFNKGSSQSRKRGKGGKANGGRKQRKDSRRQAFKLADLLPNESIKKLRAIK